jgi:hypothetical protein
MVILVHIEAQSFRNRRFLLWFRSTLPTFMAHKKFVLAYYNSPLGCLINTRKALGILLVHKIHDSRFWLFLLKWVAALVLLLGAGLRGFHLMPIFLALVLFAATISLCAFLFWLGSEDLFFKFVLEDEGIYDLATRSRALCVFDDTDSTRPQPRKKGSVRKSAMSLGNFESALSPQEGMRTVDRGPSLSALLTTIHNHRRNIRFPVTRRAITPKGKR